jgi:methylase of polypeptide subunit release factors
MQKNQLTYFDVLRNNSLAGMAERLAGRVDLLVCNPPYVETPDSEEGSCDIRYIKIQPKLFY